MVRPENLKHQDPLELPQCQDGFLLGGIVATRNDVRGRSPRQGMDTGHQRAHEPFDMATEARRGRRTIINPHAVLLATTSERLGMKFLAIV